MNVNDWARWLVEEEWDGHNLKTLLIDSKCTTTIPDLERAHSALRSLNIITTGFAGETGEALEHFKKWTRDSVMFKREAALELGDVLAYLTWLAATLGYTLEEIAQLNFEKLTARGKKEGS